MTAKWMSSTSKPGRSNLATSYSFAGAGADGSRDGIVGPEDFLIWRNHVGLASPLLDNSVSIPEPASVVLLIAVFGALTLSSLETNSR